MQTSSGANWKALTGWATVEGHLLRRKHFTPPVLAQIADRIQASEQGHSGELVVAIEAVTPARERNSRMRALEVFGRLGVWDTPQDTGVLLYLGLDRHSIELIADRGVAAPDSTWEAICLQLQTRLEHGDYIAGVLAAVDAIEAVCRRYCPASSLVDENTNVLANAPVML